MRVRRARSEGGWNVNQPVNELHPEKSGAVQNNKNNPFFSSSTRRATSHMAVGWSPHLNDL